MNEESMAERKLSALEDTPNEEELDWIEERLLKIYNYDRLKDCDIDYLYNLEYGVEARLIPYEMEFPRDGRGDLAQIWAIGDDGKSR